MQNFVQSGRTLTLPAPYDVASGGAVLVGKIFGIAVTDVASGAQGEFDTEGVFTLPVLGTDTAAVGAVAYWDATNKRLTTTATDNTRVGVFVAAKASAVAVGQIKVDAVIA
ncbi:MAG: hypothetical protein ABS43_01760 [Bordetella sp. SCN 67-23]|nr:DUF2190 family protein [Burkholderiales bacterium]ODS76296.1 MAG: hypothetical protein ABS43_01760 [Bordetella sp. SCN 67-23]ODU68693.1 MAG: hypothetical protein ABT00_19435 [Bordetella sp. SCN 68-11]OJW90099.1 MAG: hypothetical protein BGO71_27695 [Burkholderiales bacterium 67-32]